MVFNNCYLYHGDENVFLTVDDLLRFASQAANGMVRMPAVSIFFTIIHIQLKYLKENLMIIIVHFARGQKYFIQHTMHLRTYTTEYTKYLYI